MKIPVLMTLALLLLAGGLFCSDSALGQEPGSRGANNETTDHPDDKGWYYGPTSAQPETKSLGRQRAEERARQRLSRMESMKWYGFSASRPTATGIPFTTMYSPRWTRPGGRPYAWYTSQRPIVVVSPSPYYPSYYRRGFIR